MEIKVWVRIFSCITAFLIMANGAIAMPRLIVKTNTVLPQAVNSFIENIERQNTALYEIVVYQFQNYYVLDLLSNKYWKVTKIRVDLDSANNIIDIINPYQGSQEESQALLKIARSPNYPACPDPSVQYVAISAYPTVGNVKKDIDAVYQAASNQYKAIEILGDKANAQTYQAWLSCSQLKGFYSIGHGDSSELIVANGESIPYVLFHDEYFTGRYQYAQTALFFNSCEAFNRPFGSEIGFGNAFTETNYSINPGPLPATYVSGYTDLLIGASEDSSSCLAIQALAGSEINYDTLQKCVGTQDFYFRDFGISYPSTDFNKKHRR